VIIGDAVLRLFSKRGRLKRGRKKLMLKLTKDAGQAGSNSVSQTSRKSGNASEWNVGQTVGAEKNQGYAMERIEKLIQRYDRNTIDRTPWLDRLAFRRIEHINQGMSQRTSPPTIVLELERWEFVVVHGFKHYNVVPQGVRGLVRDPEVGCESPIEHKHRKLARSMHRALVDRNLKPDVHERKQIEILLQVCVCVCVCVYIYIYIYIYIYNARVCVCV
jgi:phosphatidylinositol 3-kinase